MNNELISISDESLDQVAGGALITVDVTGTVKGVASGVAAIGESVFGLFGAVAKAAKGVVGGVLKIAGAVVEIK